MKKIIIGMLLLIPLIIVASVLLAIDVITVQAYIAVDRIELNYQSLELNLSDGSFDGLRATVYPTGARNKTVIWTVENLTPTVEYDGDIAAVDQSGKITLYSYGVFDVVATAADGNKKAVCPVYVKGDRVTGITLLAPETSLEVGRNMRLAAVFSPVDAVLKEVEFTSSDPSVLRVDQNGIVVALSPGAAKITCSSDGITAESETITVLPAATYFGNEVYVPGNRVLLSDYLSGTPAVISGGHIEGGEFVFDPGADSAVLETGGKEFRFIKCASGEIIIENENILNGGEFRQGKLRLVLKAVFLESARRYSSFPSADFESSDSSIASIGSDGKVTLNASGEVVLTARSAGFSASVSIKSVKPVSLIVLDNRNESDRRGIAAETVFGNKYYENGVLKNAFLDIGIIFPSGAKTDEFFYSTDKPSVASFIDGRLEIFGDVSGIETITATVTAKISPYESLPPVFKTRTIRIKEGVNCRSFDDLKRATEAGLDAMLFADIGYPESGGNIVLRSNIYGNGRVIDATPFMDKKTEFKMIEIRASGVLISNAILRSDVPENIVKSDGLRGTILQIGSKTSPDFITGIRIEYSVLENCYHNIVADRAGFKVTGSIIRNASNFGVFLESTENGDSYSYSEAAFKNSVISNIVAPAIAVVASTPAERQSTLKIEGFLDIYNWQQLDSMRMIDRELLKGNPAVNEWLKTLLKTMLRQEFAKKDYDEIRYDEGEISYMHLGIITAGAFFDCTTVPEIEDTRLKPTELKILDNFGLRPVLVYGYDKYADITPSMEPVENEELYEKLRG
jgi:Bacterial surface proteins containing Ig-like domains